MLAIPLARQFKIALVVTLIGFGLLKTLPAAACGASGASPTGVAYCSFEEHEEEIRKKWRVGAAYGFTSTRIFFGDLTLPETRQIAMGSIAYRPTRTWTIEAGLGGLIGGELQHGSEHHGFRPGLVASAAGSWRALEASGLRPFVLFTGQLSYVDTRTQMTGASKTFAYRALDLRLGALVGWSLFHSVSPYLLARTFGGPIFWTYGGESRLGTDAYKYQFGAGLSFLVAETLDVFVEGVPLGERGVTAGAGVSF